MQTLWPCAIWTVTAAPPVSIHPRSPMVIAPIAKGALIKVCSCYWILLDKLPWFSVVLFTVTIIITIDIDCHCVRLVYSLDIAIWSTELRMLLLIVNNDAINICSCLICCNRVLCKLAPCAWWSGWMREIRRYLDLWTQCAKPLSHHSYVALLCHKRKL